MKEWVQWIWSKVITAIDFVTNRYLYVIPMVMGSIFVFISVFIIISVFTAVDDMDRSIKSIPVIVQTEMQKTRDTLVEQGNVNREVIVTQHEATRDELQRRMDAAEKERLQTKALLDKLQKGQEQRKIEEKRQKVLGIF